MLNSKYANRFIVQLDAIGKNATFVRIFLMEIMPGGADAPEPHSSIVMSIADFKDMNRVVEGLLKPKKEEKNAEQQ